MKVLLGGLVGVSGGNDDTGDTSSLLRSLTSVTHEGANKSKIKRQKINEEEFRASIINATN